MFVMWGLQNSSPGHLKAMRSQNETNMRGSSRSLENMEISKKIHRKSKFISSRGEDTEVTMQLLSVSVGTGQAAMDSSSSKENSSDMR